MAAHIRAIRETAGLSQGELAERAGVSRQLIGAAEAGRNLPRVDAALAIAAALGVGVAELFSTAPPPQDVLTGMTPPDGTLVRAATVGDRTVVAAAELASRGWDVADGVIDGGALTSLGNHAPGLVVAGCEPGLELLERILREGRMGAIAASSSSAVAIDALEAGRVHAALVHGPEGTVEGRASGYSVDRFRVARWRVGLCAPADSAPDWWRMALDRRVRVVQRETGAGVQRTFEEAAGGAVPGPRVRTHLAAARRSVLTAMAAVTIEPAALAVGASFHALDIHEAELWVDRAWMTQRLVGEALEVISGRRFQRRLESIGGYDLVGCGERVG